MSRDDGERTAEIPIYGQVTIESRLLGAPSSRHLTVYTTGVIEDAYWAILAQREKPDF